MKKDSSSNDSSNPSLLSNKKISSKKESSASKTKIKSTNKKKRLLKQLKITQIVFSEREKLILHYVAQGKSPAEIAELLGIAQNTCYFYLRNIVNKLGKLCIV